MAFLIFAATAAPAVAPGHDSGELTTAAYTLGVCHPPGYPLYVRLGHLWGQLWPWGNYAWRLNLFSSLGVALAAAALAWLVQRATACGWSGLAAGLGFALLRSCWGQAVIAEVFGLHLALLGGLAVTARSGRVSWFFLLLGACLAHHHTFVLSLPGLAALIWLSPSRPAQWRPSWRWLLWLLPFLGFYLDMMGRARAQPGLNWGDPSQFESLLHHFLRRSYGTFQLTVSVEPLESGVAHGLGYVLFTLWQQAPWLWMGVALLGAVQGRKVDRPLWWMAWLWLLGNGPFFALIGRQKLDAFHLDLLERFYCSSYLGLALFFGLGMASLKRAWRPLLVLALLVWQGWANWEGVRLDRRELCSSYVRQVLSSCPTGSLLVVNGDLPVGAFEYSHAVLGERPDVEPICPGLMGGAWYRAQIHPRLAQWWNGEVGDLVEQAYRAGVPVLFSERNSLTGVWRPRALCWQWYPPGTRVQDLDLVERCLRSVMADSQRLLPGLGEESRFWPRFMVSLRIASLRGLSGELYETRPQLALAGLERAIELGADRDLDYLNRALLYQALGRHQRALVDLEVVLQRQPAWRVASLARTYSLVAQMGEMAGQALIP